MGSSIWKSACCGERGGGAKIIERRSQQAFWEKKRTMSIGYHSHGADAEKFDSAYIAGDISALVGLLTSTQVVDSFEERLHPWIEDPTTIGALAAVQIAIFASAIDEVDESKVKDRIREAGAIPLLVDFLRSPGQDRVQAAVVALRFLTVDCSQNAVAAFEAAAMPLLLTQLLSSSVAGIRGNAATALANLCVESDEYRAEFVRTGGIEGLVAQLGATPDPELNHDDTMLGAVQNLQDVLEDSERHMVPEYVAIAQRAGAEKYLQELAAGSADQEVKDCAAEVLQSMSEAQQKGKT